MIIEQFIEQIRAADNTKRNYRNTLNIFAAWAGKDAPESSEEAQNFLTWREVQGKRPQTVSLDAAALRRYLNWKGIPVTRLEKYPVLLQPPEYLSVLEIKRLMAACDTPLVACIVALLYDSGCRISEILGARMTGIDWQGFLQVVRKGGRPDTANISEWGMGYLRTWLEERRGSHPKIFGDHSYRYIYGKLKVVAKNAGIPNFKPHMLRHSRAVHLSEDTDLRWEEIGYQLGHVNPSVTSKIYTRLDPYDLKRRIPAPNL